MKLWKNISIGQDSGIDSANESKLLSKKSRQAFAVWNYPLGQTYTKLFNSMNSTGWVKSIDEGVQMILESSAEQPFMLLEDSTNAKYLSSANCDLNILNVKSVGVKSYGFILAKQNFFLKEIFSQSLLEMSSNGFLDDLKNKWWPPCKKDEIDGSISLGSTGGMFILLATCVTIVAIILGVQILSRKSKRGLFKSKTNNEPTSVGNLYSSNFQRGIQSISYF